MPGFQSTQLATEGALEPFFFLYTDDSIQGNPETCKQSSIMLNYEVKNTLFCRRSAVLVSYKYSSLTSVKKLSSCYATRGDERIHSIYKFFCFLPVYLTEATLQLNWRGELPLVWFASTSISGSIRYTFTFTSTSRTAEKFCFL